MARSFSSGSTYQYASRTEYGDDTDSYTCACIARINTGAAFSAFFGRTSNDSENEYMFHFGTSASSTALQFAVFNGTGGSTTGTYTITTGTWYLMIGRYVPSTTLTLDVYSLAGSSLSSTSGTAPSAIGRSSNKINVGRGHGNPISCEIARSAIWKSNESNADMLTFFLDGGLIKAFPVWYSEEPDADSLRGDTASVTGTPGLVANPAIQPHRIFRRQTGGYVPTAYTLAAAAGSFGLTGTAASLELGAVVAAAAGSFALSGTAASLEYGAVIAAAAGSYGLTGSDAALTFGFVLAAASGSYAVTGTVAGLIADRVIAAAAGSYSMTGADATLVYSIILAASSGSFALSGAALSLIVDYVLAASAGSYGLTGTAANLEYGAVLSAAGGAFALSGTAASLEYGAVVAAEAGGYSLSGATVSFLVDYVFPTASGSYGLTGADAGLNWGTTLVTSSGSYTVTGTDAGLLASLLLTAAPGAYLISGTEAALTTSAIRVTPASTTPALICADFSTQIAALVPSAANQYGDQGWTYCDNPVDVGSGGKLRRFHITCQTATRGDLFASTPFSSQFVARVRVSYGDLPPEGSDAVITEDGRQIYMALIERQEATVGGLQNVQYLGADLDEEEQGFLIAEHLFLVTFQYRGFTA